jgi:hypothetical protein
MHANTNSFSGKWLITYIDSSIHRIRNEETIGNLNITIGPHGFNNAI